MKFLQPGLRSKSGVISAVMAILVIALAAGSTRAPAQPPLLPLGIGGIEGLTPSMPIQATSTSPRGEIVEGITTIDPNRRSSVRVMPNVATDATGIISGVADLYLYVNDTLVLVQEVPVKGRARSAVHERWRVDRTRIDSAPNLNSVTDKHRRTHVQMAMRGRFFDSSVRQFYAFNLVTRLFHHQLNGQTFRGAPFLLGRVNVAIPRQHAAWSRVQIAAIGFAIAEWYYNPQALSVLLERGVFRGQSAVVSPSLGLRSGGTLFARARWWVPATRPPGFFNANGRVERFRFSMGGFLFVTLAEALASFDVEELDELVDEVLVRRELFSSPSAVETFHFNVIIRDLERLD